MLNEYRRSEDLPSFTLQHVECAYVKLKPMVCRVKNRPQGSTDMNAPRSRARLNWVTQLLVKFGKLDSSELESLINPVTGELSQGDVSLPALAVDKNFQSPGIASEPSSLIAGGAGKESVPRTVLPFRALSIFTAIRQQLCNYHHQDPTDPETR
jgi:hypothetical protein